MLKVYSVYDSKAELFGTPMFFINKGTAVRSFQEVVNNPQSQLNKFPEDYTLFEVGSFDDLKGVLIPLSTPVSLGLAMEFKKKDGEK